MYKIIQVRLEKEKVGGGYRGRTEERERRKGSPARSPRLPRGTALLTALFRYFSCILFFSVSEESNYWGFHYCLPTQPIFIPFIYFKQF